jgi:hypothetical protein
MVERFESPLKRYRRRLRAWGNHRKLEREREYYNELFLSRGHVLPDEEAVRAALKKKYPRLTSRRKGSLHILALYHHYNWEDYSLKPALERFGSVRHYDWC